MLRTVTLVAVFFLCVISISNEVHRKTDTLFPGNNTTGAELEPLTIRSGGSSSNN